MVAICRDMAKNRTRDFVPGVGALLRAARDATGMSQAKAAEASGVHVVSIARFETDVTTPTLATLIKLADAYGVDVCDLIPEAVRKKPKKK